MLEDPSLPAAVKDLLAEQAQALKQKEAELLEYKRAYSGNTKSALNAAMQVIFRHGTLPIPKSEAFTFFSWRELPPQIRLDPDCLIQAMRDKNVHIERSDIPEELLTHHRILAWEACKAGINPSFCPKPEEWRNHQALSRYALKRGLIKSMSDAPMLTIQHVLDFLRKDPRSWDKVPGNLKRSESFCQSALQLGCTLFVKNIFEAFPSLAQKWNPVLHDFCLDRRNLFCPPKL